jgi:hypothetical protein
MADRSSWSDAALCAEVVDLALAAERANARLAVAVGDWRAREAWRSDGSASGPAWLVEHTPMTRPAAARLCRSARLVHDHEQTAKALDVGDVTAAHVEVLAGAVRRREELYPAHEDTLLNAASSLTPDDLVTVARRWRSLADDQLAAVDAAAAHEQRFFHVSPTFGGGRIDGFIDPTGTATLIRALDALVPPDPAGTPDPRPLSVRSADGLVMLAEQWLDAPERAGRASCTLNLVIDVDTLLGKASLDACEARCDLDDFGPVGRAIAERLACDAKVARIVMADTSKVLDLGRSTRVVSPALRRAVLIRDKHCQRKGCRVPAKWCDVHHIIHWLHGGETNLDNLVLLCRRHHVDHHEGAWTINRQLDGSVTTEWTTPYRHRRRRRRRREQSGEPNLS